jgi:hypothetical protein
MTDKKALLAAEKRWGRLGAVKRAKLKDGTTRYTVGRVMLGMFFEVEGQGETWEAAFADADQNRAKQSAR